MITKDGCGQTDLRLHRSLCSVKFYLLL